LSAKFNWMIVLLALIINMELSVVFSLFYRYSQVGV
jgi:hypothetical protein